MERNWMKWMIVPRLDQYPIYYTPGEAVECVEGISTWERWDRGRTETATKAGPCMLIVALEGRTPLT